MAELLNCPAILRVSDKKGGHQNGRRIASRKGFIAVVQLQDMQLYYVCLWCKGCHRHTYKISADMNCHFANEHGFHARGYAPNVEQDRLDYIKPYSLPLPNKAPRVLKAEEMVKLRRGGRRLGGLKVNWHDNGQAEEGEIMTKITYLFL